MAQDPEEQNGEQDSAEVNLSHDLDMVSIFQSQTVEAELDAENIHGVLESNGIVSVVERSSGYPNLGVEILVARADSDRAKTVIAEALASGPEAADEAEAESESEEP